MPSRDDGKRNTLTVNPSDVTCRSSVSVTPSTCQLSSRVIARAIVADAGRAGNFHPGPARDDACRPMRRAAPALRLLGLLPAAALMTWWPLSSSWGVDVHTPNGLVEVEHGGVHLGPLAIGPWSVAIYPPDAERTWQDAVGSRC